MRILIVTQIYLPEMGALANRIYPIAKKLVAEGHEVVIATGMPNYPAGKVFPEYRGKLLMKEKRDGYTILRTHYYTAPRNQSKISQLLSYLAFMPAAFLSGLRGGKFDVVFITSPPIFPVIPAIILAKLRGAKLVYDIRDLWSDELVTYGGLKNTSPVIRLARRMEKWGYTRADLITVTTDSLGDTAVERGAGRDKIAYLPNGADLELFKPLPRENKISAEYDFGNRFVVMYSGLFGIKHGLETLLEAAEMLRANPNICFFLIGDGARRSGLQEIVRAKKLTNVIIAAERKVEDIPHVLARADVGYAATRSEAYPKKLISVKPFEYMACAKPIVAAIAGETANVIEKAGAGIVVPCGDARAVADGILKLYENPQLRELMGESGKYFVEKNFSRNFWAARFEQLLTRLVEPLPALLQVEPEEKIGVRV